MRDYGKVSPKFWTGKTGKDVKKHGHEAVIVALYLMTSPHADMLGLYYCPVVYISHDTGLSIEGASKGLQRCIEAGFCDYDTPLELVWVYRMAEYQIAPSLSAKDNQVKAIEKAFLSFPECKHLQGFYDVYKDKFHLPKHPFLEGGYKAPFNPLRSQEQEQEQEQEQDLCAEPKSSTPKEERKNKQPKKDNQEHDSRNSGELPLKKIVIELPLNVKGTYYEVTQESVDEWASIYPGIDVKQQLRNMLGWLNANPGRKKTKSGINKFINGWLSREQNNCPQKSPMVVVSNAMGFKKPNQQRPSYDEYMPSVDIFNEMPVISGERIA